MFPSELIYWFRCWCLRVKQNAERRTLLFFLSRFSFTAHVPHTRPRSRIELLQFYHSALVSDSCRCHTFISYFHVEITIYIVRNTERTQNTRIVSCSIGSEGKWNHRSVKRKYHHYYHWLDRLLLLVFVSTNYSLRINKNKVIILAHECDARHRVKCLCSFRDVDQWTWSHFRNFCTFSTHCGARDARIITSLTSAHCLLPNMEQKSTESNRVDWSRKSRKMTDNIYHYEFEMVRGIWSAKECKNVANSIAPRRRSHRT